MSEFKRQLGLGPDPRRHEVVPANGKVPKLVRTGLDSDQPGFPVYHRHIASPLALGCLAFGASMLAFGLCLVHVRGMKTTTIFYAIGLPYGGGGATLAGLWYFPQGNTYGMTLFTLLGGIITSLTLANLPWTGIQLAYLTEAPSLLEGLSQLESALGLLAFVCFILIFLLQIASLRTSVPVFVAILIINIALILYGASAFLGKDALSVGCGALMITVGLVLFYLGAADLLADEGFPILPLLPLPNVEE